MTSVHTDFAVGVNEWRCLKAGPVRRYVVGWYLPLSWCVGGVTVGCLRRCSFSSRCAGHAVSVLCVGGGCRPSDRWRPSGLGGEVCSEGEDLFDVR